MNALSGSAPRASSPSVINAPSRPTKAPSKTNGQRMKASEAPTRRMISISSPRATTARRMVFTMMKSAMIPTTISTTVPAVRRMSVTVTRFAMKSFWLRTLRMIGSFDGSSRSLTTATSAASTILTSKLANSGFVSR